MKNRVKSVLNYKKPAFWIIVVAIVASIVVAVCFLTNPKQDTDLGVSSQKFGSDLKGITLEIVDTDLSAPDPFIKVKWTNDTDKKVSYGDEFYIYQNINDAWEDCRNDSNYFWTLPEYLTLPNSTSEKDYHLNGLIMTQTGKYRFETEFSVDGVSDQKYKAWIEFELTTGVEGITVHTFEPVALVYDDGRYSFVQTAENTPTYRIVNAMQLQEIDANGTVATICNLEPITLNNDNFDTRFMGGSECWLEDETIKSLKGNNKRAWQQTVSDGDNHLLYLLLEQNDGTFYLGYGYYGIAGEDTHNPDDSHIRWLYRLSSASVSDVGGADGPDNVTVDSSKKPPTLTVSCGNMSVNAWLGTYTWLYKNLDDGMAQAINADSSHPLSMLDKIPTLLIVPSPLSSVEPRLAVLQFANTPDKIEVRCYKVDEKDTDKGEVISTEDMTFQMKEGKYLYEIIAKWTDTKESSGTAYYAFQTMESDMQIVDTNNVSSTDTKLTTAISSVLNEKYQAVKPDGLIHIENYYLL